MKILHINDQAGVACILAKYQRMNGITSKVLSFDKIDKFGILKFYKDYIDIVDRSDFVEYCISAAKDADIIHVHSMTSLIFTMRKKYGTSKKIILHYHGTDIRGLKNESNLSTVQKIKNSKKSFMRELTSRLRLLKNGYYRSAKTESQRLADEILVATPDLLSLVPNAKYLPNPVDLDHFSRDNSSNSKLDYNALTIETETGNTQKTIQYCKENNIDLDICVFDRTKTPLLYEHVPDLLKKYNTYVDIRVVNDKILENFSKTALESLACGLKVLNYKLEYIDKFPEIHNPINVVNMLQKIYSKM